MLTFLTLLARKSLSAAPPPDTSILQPQFTSRPIVMLIGRLYGGGAERVVAALANAWAARGEEVHIVISTQRAARETDYQVSPQVQRHYLGQASWQDRLDAALPWLGRLISQLTNLTYRTLQRLGKRGVSAGRLLLGWRWRRESAAIKAVVDKLDAPVVLVFGTSLFPLALVSFANKGQRFVALERNDPALDAVLPEIRLSRPLVYQQATLVAVNSRRALQTVAPCTDEGKVAYLPNPLFDNDLLNEAIDEGARQPTILIVARLVPQKNHELLMRAFAALPSALHQWRLAVVGDGILRNDLEQIACQLQINERVDWHGYVTDPLPLYRRASIFVLPSRYEGQSNALLEAMALGLAVMVSDTPTLVEMVKDGEIGLVVPVQQVEQWTMALARLATDGALRRQLGDAARAHVRSHELATVLPQWDQLLARA